MCLRSERSKREAVDCLLYIYNIDNCTASPSVDVRRGPTVNPQNLWDDDVLGILRDASLTSMEDNGTPDTKPIPNTVDLHKQISAKELLPR